MKSWRECKELKWVRQIKESEKRREERKQEKGKIFLEYAKGQIMFNNLSNFMRYKYDDRYVMTSFSPRIERVLGHLDNGAGDGTGMKHTEQGDRLVLLGS